MAPLTDNRPEYFFCDAHFGAHDAQTERVKVDRFVSFLAHPDRTGSTVWCLGDLFDFWLEYRRAIPRVSVRVLAAIQSFVEREGQFHLLLGNHDFWVRDFLAEEVGITLHHGDVRIERDGKSILLTHGDGKAKSDRGYRLLKQVLRFGPGIWAYRHLPVDWAFALASSSSRSSRRLTARRQDRFEAEYRLFAERELSGGTHAVLMGHLHRSILKRIGDGWYINCGEWFERFSYVVRERGAFSLQYWTRGRSGSESATGG